MFDAPVKIAALSIFPNKYAKNWTRVPTFVARRWCKEGACQLHQEVRRCYSALQRFFCRESPKNLSDDLSRRGQRFVRSRALVGLLLLFVTAHAFVAGSTHFHSRTVSGAQSSRAAIHGDEGGRQSVPLAGDEARCLLCRLQRSFVSDLQSATLVIAPQPADALGYFAPRNIYPRASRALLPPGRAPPSA